MSSIVTGNLLKNIPITQLILVTIGITAISFLFSKQYLHALISVLAIIVVQQLFSIEEGFTTDSTKEFLDLQSTINPLKNFDMDAIGRQATQEEMDYYLKNKMWPWSEELKEVYTSAIISNPYVRLETHYTTGPSRSPRSKETGPPWSATRESAT